MIWPHSEISHLLFNPNFGLCVASFRGVIEIFDSIELLRSSLGNDQDSAEHDLLNVFFHNSPTKNSILFDFDDTSKVSSPMFGE